MLVVSSFLSSNENVKHKDYNIKNFCITNLKESDIQYNSNYCYFLTTGYISGLHAMLIEQCETSFKENCIKELEKINAYMKAFSLCMNQDLDFKECMK